MTGKSDFIKNHKLAFGIFTSLAIIWIASIAWSGPVFLRHWDSLFRSVAPLWIIFLAFAVPAYAFFISKQRRIKKQEQAEREKADAQDKKAYGTVFRGDYKPKEYLSDKLMDIWPAHAIAFAGLLVAGGFMLLYQNYHVDNTYAQRAVVTDTPATSFNDRAPWVVANNYASRDQGENVGTRGDVNHVPVSGGESSRYTTLITGRAFMNAVGYDSVREFDLPKVGAIPQSAATSCDMPEAMKKRWNTIWPTYSLERELAWASPFSHWNDEDLYGYCDGKNPVVVMPLWKYDGFWTVTKVPAGAAVYDVKGFRILSGEELVKENIQGPTYPGSLVKIEREALTAMGSYSDWWGNRAGYELTDKDAEDANNDNTSDFTLVGADNKLYYTTPLTPRGSSQSIVALMVAPAQQDGKNSVTYRIETVVNLPATSVIENNLRSASVTGDSEWTTRWAAGMKVYEIVPNKDGHWNASIGLGQVVNYRANVAPDGSVTVTRTDGGGSPSKDPKDTTTVSNGKPLSEMSKEELIKLMEDALAELEKRD